VLKTAADYPRRSRHAAAVRVPHQQRRDPAPQVAQLYKRRWQVGLFFDWIKQHLRINAICRTSISTVKTSQTQAGDNIGGLLSLNDSCHHIVNGFARAPVFVVQAVRGTMHLFSNTGEDAHGHDHLRSKAAGRVLAVVAGRSVQNCLLVGRGLAGLVAQSVSAARGRRPLVARRLAVPADAAEPDPGRDRGDRSTHPAGVLQPGPVLRGPSYSPAPCGAGGSPVAVGADHRPHLDPARVDGSLAPRLSGRPLRLCRQHPVAFSQPGTPHPVARFPREASRPGMLPE